MTIKLALLKSGEDIISDISEMTSGDRVIGYYMTKPCVVKLLKPNIQEGGKPGVEITLYPWMPLTKDTEIPIPADWLVTMVEPVDNLKEMYTRDVIEHGKDNQSDSTGEQSDSDQSD
tara:strand:- start:4757 stop:5107 length:351 start_codon:yes stop_codon:yes gene_type:complete